MSGTIIDQIAEMAKTMTLALPKGRVRLSQDDCGKLFWRVEYKGVLSQYRVEEVFENGKGSHAIAAITDLRGGYGFREKIEYYAISEFGLDVISKPEFFTDFEAAKRASKERYYREENPNGDYRVARLFDDVWEAWETGILTKPEAEKRAAELNKRKRHYVRYQSLLIKS